MFVAVSGAVMLVTALTGCVWLLTLGRCSDLYTCNDTEVVSVPPQNDPLSAALATPVRVEDVLRRLTDVVRTQYASLGDRWPDEAQCTTIASTGCRYAMTLRFIKRQNTCADKTFLVTTGLDGRPTVTGGPTNLQPCDAAGKLQAR